MADGRRWLSLVAFAPGESFQLLLVQQHSLSCGSRHTRIDVCMRSCFPSHRARACRSFGGESVEPAIEQQLHLPTLPTFTSAFVLPPSPSLSSLASHLSHFQSPYLHRLSRLPPFSTRRFSFRLCSGRRLSSTQLTWSSPKTGEASTASSKLPTAPRTACTTSPPPPAESLPASKLTVPVVLHASCLTPPTRLQSNLILLQPSHRDRSPSLSANITPSPPLAIHLIC